MGRPDDLVSGLVPVGLARLDEAAALMTRRDRKYVLPTDAAERLVDRLSGPCRVLEIEGRRFFAYESVYFDTPSRVSYLGAARRRPHRFKVRTRAYLDTGRSLLEVKTRDARGRTHKERCEHDFGARDELVRSDVELLRAIPLIGDQARLLQPVLRTRYMRTTPARRRRCPDHHRCGPLC
jgi:hypothetical protein